ncbi:hypothetical protein M9458_049637, partial [Cirrhinus mrigala]
MVIYEKAKQKKITHAGEQTTQDRGWQCPQTGTLRGVLWTPRPSTALTQSVLLLRGQKS